MIWKHLYISIYYQKLLLMHASHPPQLLPHLTAAHQGRALAQHSPCVAPSLAAPAHCQCRGRGASSSSLSWPVRHQRPDNFICISENLHIPNALSPHGSFPQGSLHSSNISNIPHSSTSNQDNDSLALGILGISWSLKLSKQDKWEIKSGLKLFRNSLQSHCLLITFYQIFSLKWAGECFYKPIFPQASPNSRFPIRTSALVVLIHYTYSGLSQQTMI